MRNIGMYLVFFGGGSFVLNLMGLEFALLGWIDNWGESVGVGIRVGAIVIGAALFLLGSRTESGSGEPEAS